MIFSSLQLLCGISKGFSSIQKLIRDEVMFLQPSTADGERRKLIFSLLYFGGNIHSNLVLRKTTPKRAKNMLSRTPLYSYSYKHICCCFLLLRGFLFSSVFFHWKKGETFLGTTSSLGLGFPWELFHTQANTLFLREIKLSHVQCSKIFSLFCKSRAKGLFATKYPRQSKVTLHFLFLSKSREKNNIP